MWDPTTREGLLAWGREYATETSKEDLLHELTRDHHYYDLRAWRTDDGRRGIGPVTIDDILEGRAHLTGASRLDLVIATLVAHGMTKDEILAFMQARERSHHAWWERHTWHELLNGSYRETIMDFTEKTRPALKMPPDWEAYWESSYGSPAKDLEIWARHARDVYLWYSMFPEYYNLTPWPEPAYIQEGLDLAARLKALEEAHPRPTRKPRGRAKAPRPVLKGQIDPGPPLPRLPEPPPAAPEPALLEPEPTAPVHIAGAAGEEAHRPHGLGPEQLSILQ